MTTILVDNDLSGHLDYLIAAVREAGWEQDLALEFKRLRDCGLPDNCPDQKIWRYAQAQQWLIVTHNRNNKGPTSLHATIARENTPDSLPVITVSDKEKLKHPDYRRRVVARLIEIILYPKQYLGVGRIFVP